MLFGFLSLAMHFLALVIFAANYEFSSLKAEETDSEAAIQVETVNLPPSMPPPSEAPPPPSQQAPPPMQEQPPPEPPEPEQIAERPITPPSVNPTPVPTPTPTPQEGGSSAEPTPSAAPQPSVTPIPAPTQTPTPEEVAAQREQIAKKMLREQGLDVPDDYQLPAGIKSFEELLIAVSPEKQKELNDASSAYWQERFGLTPDNTRGSDQGIDPNATPDPNAPTPDPNASYDPNAPRSGVRFGDLDRSLDRRLDGSRLGDVNLDPLRRPRLQNDLDEALDEEDPYGRVDELDRGLRNFDTGLGTPTPPPIELPTYRTGTVGSLQYITFDYQNRKFNLQWPGSEEDNKRVSVKHFPGNNPAAIESFEVRWLPEWQDNPEALVRAVLEEYRRRSR